MNNSSNSIRILPILKRNFKYQPLALRLKGRNTHSHPYNLVLSSIENMKRISELDRELAVTNQQHR
jgi:hypothetical protein